MTTETDDIAGMLRESACDFAAREQDHRGLRQRMGRLPGYDTRTFAQMQELGWRPALISQQLGGAGMGLREASALAEELGRALLGEPFVATAVLPVRLFQDAGARAPAEALLQAASAGSKTLALAWQEQPGSIDPAGIATEARRESSGLVLSGRKSWVAGAAAATDFLVSAKLDGGVAVFHVPSDAPGLEQSNAWQVDGTPLMELRLRDVQVDAGAMLVPPADGATAVARALDAGAVVASAELLGVARAAFDMTLAYLRTRVQFDKIIGSFQALQHKAVDLLVQRELAASVLEEATAAFDARKASDDELARLASRCKARCSDAALRITRESIQLHGAIGYTHECDIGLYLKRSMVLSAWLGNATQHRRRHASITCHKGD